MGVTEVLSRAGLGCSLAKVIGRALRIALTLIAIFAALSLLGLQFLSESLNAGVLLPPKLLVAAALLTALLLVLIAILLAGATATIALAFGLGGRDVARELSAGRTLRGIYSSGQRISFAAAEGTVKEVSNAITVIDTDRGVVHVPNSLLLGSVVAVDRADDEAQ